MWRAQERQVLHVEPSDRMEGTSSFVMMVAIRAAGRWSSPGIPGFGSGVWDEEVAISVFLDFRACFYFHGNWRP